MVNLTNLTINENPYIPYSPDDACFDWALEQHVVHSNNMELYGILFPAFAFAFIVLYFWADEIPWMKKYKVGFIYSARLLLILFFGFYILIIRLRIIWFN